MKAAYIATTVEFAMREVDDPHHAEDDGQAQRHQSIDKTGKQRPER